MGKNITASWLKHTAVPKSRFVAQLVNDFLFRWEMGSVERPINMR